MALRHLTSDLARSLSLASAVMLLAALAQAHGGMYRGGWNAPPAPPGSAGVPGGPAGSGGPTTGARPAVIDGTSWQVWWEYSKNPLLQASDWAPRVPTGGDDFYLGSTRGPVASPPPDGLPPAARDRIAEALADALESTDNRDISTAAMIALGKLGRGPKGRPLLELLSARLSDGNQEVRESAALAIGISGQLGGIEILAALVADTRAGRKLRKGSVDDRTRTFAAWGLGLIASRAKKPEDKRRVHDVLLEQLLDDKNKSRDLRVGLIQGLGLLGEQESGANKMLLWRTAAELWKYFERDMGRGDQLVQAHVPIAIARLLGRGASSEHEAAKGRMLRVLTGKRRVHQAIRQSAAMALGTMCLPPEQHEDDAAICAALVDHYKNGTDQLARHFSVMALGRIGGKHNREVLLKLWPAANGNIERPWIAMSLGLIARDHRLATGAVDRTIAERIYDEFVDREADDPKAAFALAVGLTGLTEAEVELLPLLDSSFRRWQLIGYSCIGLSLIESRIAIDRMLRLLDQRRREPFIVQQAALGLARLHTPKLMPKLIGLLEKSDSVAELAAIANALSLVGDETTVEPLIKAIGDKARPKMARAFCAAALGGIADKDEMPWSTRIAVGMNYMATVDTLTNGSTGILDIL
ncbi:MAG: HEAT repeat domain-containing protein [Planctomycetota bacterium]